MTGGFLVNARGIEIDITQTLNKFLKQNKEIYTRKEFEDYLSSINLDRITRNNSGQCEPISEGFVVSFDFDEGDDQEAFGILTTGLWQYQYWAQERWSKEDLEQQTKFNNPEYLNKSVENHLNNLWKDKLVLTDKFAIHNICCEWPIEFFLKDI